MRQIVIDTETTGLEPEKGHRIIEIGCVELINRKLTGNNFHKYINPGQGAAIDAEALTIHGITSEFLQDKPPFAKILDEFLAFINGAELIAHNADFDVSFINHEIKLIAKDAHLLDNYVTIFDTLMLARTKFPGQRNTLDAICKRYKIDLSERKLHGALLDAQLLAEAYLLMTGGQGDLFANYDFMITEAELTNSSHQNHQIEHQATQVLYANDAEITAHNSLLETMQKKSGKCLWRDNEKQ